MISEKRIITSGKEARAKLCAGINKVANLVKPTLGPHARSVIIQRKYKAPIVVDDGIRILKSIYLDDKIEDLGAQSLIEIANKTNQRAGDGTTTSVVIAQRLINHCLGILDDERQILGHTTRAVDLYRAIQSGKQRVIADLKAMAIPCETPEQIQNVISVALKDEELTKMLTDIVVKVGKDGFIDIEEGFETETKAEVISGFRGVGTYVSPHLITNDRREAVMNGNSPNKLKIIITNHVLDDPKELVPVVQAFMKEGINKFVLLAAKYEPAVIPTIIYNHQKLLFDMLAIKTPALTSEELEDVAAYTGGVFIDKNKGMKFRDIIPDNAGEVDRAVVNEDSFVLLGGAGEKINERIERLRGELKVENLDKYRKKLERRIASLSGGIGKIILGRSSDLEEGYIQHKVEDAINAAKAALEEGIVPGGGIALKKIVGNIADSDSFVLSSALLAPYEQLQENAGYPFVIPESVVDPVKVVRSALENACSVASMLIMIDSAVAFDQIKLTDELEELIARGRDPNRVPTSGRLNDEEGRYQVIEKSN
jgi:chaperonin GroEL